MSNIILFILLYCSTIALSQQTSRDHKISWIKGLTEQQYYQVDFNFKLASSIQNNKLFYKTPNAFYLNKQDLEIINYYQTHTYFYPKVDTYNQYPYHLKTQPSNDYFHNYISPFVISPLEKPTFINIPQQ